MQSPNQNLITSHQEMRLAPAVVANSLNAAAENNEALVARI